MSTQISRREFLGLAGGAAAVFGLGLAGCGSSSTGTDSGSVSSAGSSSSSSKSTYTIVMDTVYAPFEFTDDDGNFVGIDVDIINAVAKDQGFDIDIKSIGFDAALAAIESGQADGMIAGMSITDERKKKYDFSDSYYNSYVCAAAKADSDISSLDDVAGMTVAAKTATTGCECADTLASTYGYSVTYFDTSDLMYQDVLSGNSAVCFEDYPVLAYGITQDSGLKIVDEEKEDFSSPYGFAVKKGENAELLSMFQAGLKNLKESGELDEICAKYFGE